MLFRSVYYGSSGTGGSVHMATELFNQMAGTKLTHVSYKGQGPALNDVLAGQIQFLMGSPLVIYPHVKSGRLRGLAVSTAKRVTSMAEIPPIGDIVQGYETSTWQAILGPKGLPREITALWNREIERVLNMPDFKERMINDAMEPGGGPPSRFLAVLQRDVAKWRRVVKAGNIKVGA